MVDLPIRNGDFPYYRGVCPQPVDDVYGIPTFARGFWSEMGTHLTKGPGKPAKTFWKMAIEIVDLSMTHGDFPYLSY